jgi:acetyl-CoA C-acetyltransferase
MQKYIINALRTPIGKFLGSFYECNPLEVCDQLMEETIKTAPNKKDFQYGVFGNAIQGGMGQSFQRSVCLKAGLPLKMPSYTINMVCGSGAEAVINACEKIDLGMSLGIAGGYEFMSNIPYATNTYLRLGKKFGNFEMVDLMLKDGLVDYLDGEHMGLTAERIAKKYSITRIDQDKFAFRSQSLAKKAIENGCFNDEIVPINLLDYKKRPFTISQDEFPHFDTSMEKLAQLKPTFLKNGTLTAGNVSGINDGACFMSIASAKYVKKHSLTPLAEIVDYVSIGCDHKMMGLGPYFAIKALLKKEHLDLKDISLLEINEAFAAQVVACLRLLSEKYYESFDSILTRTNIHGGGISLGHPLGCSGARIITTLAHTMKREGYKDKYGIASMCIGGGQGIAVLIKGV